MVDIQDFGEIDLGKFKTVEYEVKKESTKSAYVFIRVEIATEGLHKASGIVGQMHLAEA